MDLQRAVERDRRAVNTSAELLLRAKALAQQTDERVCQALEQDRGQTAHRPFRSPRGVLGPFRDKL